MVSYEERLADANAIYQQGMERVKNTPPPDGQKFAPGTRVHIAKDLGPMMQHFKGDVDATVLYTYAHAYGGDDVESYSLGVDGYGTVAWYKEWQLTEI